ECHRLNPVRPFYGFALHPQGRRIAIAHDSYVSIRDLETDKTAMQLRHPFAPWSLAWRPDGRVLAVAGSDVIHVWDLDHPPQPRTVCKGHQSDGIELTFTARGDLLLSHCWDGTVRLWDPWIGKELLTIPNAYLQANEFHGLRRYLPIHDAGRQARLLELAAG